MNDAQLQQLIDKICGNPDPNSPDRRRAINRLLFELQKLPQIRRSSHPIYLQALDTTWVYVSNNICTFKPKPNQSIRTSLVNWINKYLRWRIHDLYSNQQGQSRREYSLDTPIDDDNLTNLLDQLSETGFTPPKLSGLDAYLEEQRQENICTIWQKLQDYLEEDPEMRLRNCHPNRHPNCNCQYLCQRRLFQDPPDGFAQISRELGVNYQTLNSHWKNKCLPLIRQILESLGYSRNEES